MRIGKYKINLSERGKHYMELLGGWFCIAVMVISLSAVFMWAVSGTGEYDNLQVKHIYEDGCFDVYDTETDKYYFYCEDKTFYSEN